MIPTKRIFIISLLMMLYAQGHSQNSYRGCYGFDCKEKKWSLAIFAGASILGPGQDIENQMIASGLGDVRPAADTWFGPLSRIDYPLRSSGLVWNLEARYDVSKKSGVQMTVGNTYHSVVEGYDHIGNGNHLRIKSNLATASFNYIWKIRRGKDALAIGPVMASFATVADNAYRYGSPVSRASTLKAGFNMGYTFSLIQKKSWFLALKANYTWLPDAEIGPYTQQHEQAPADKPIQYISTFNKTNVQLSTINFGLSAGWRF